MDSTGIYRQLGGSVFLIDFSSDRLIQRHEQSSEDTGGRVVAPSHVHGTELSELNSLMQAARRAMWFAWRLLANLAQPATHQSPSYM